MRPGQHTPASEIDWDQRYSEQDRIWSSEPNGALVAEVADLPPGRALDVGCGEGADAVWLARRGWDVTAFDVSGVALDRARRHAADAGVELTWVHAGLLDLDVEPGSFDLVSAQYPALLVSPDHDAERALLAAVAPGGTLLFVHHLITAEAAHRHGFDPDEYVSPADVRAQLDPAGWDVAFDGGRPRHLTTGSGAGHSHDVVVRATRRG